MDSVRQQRDNDRALHDTLLAGEQLFSTSSVADRPNGSVENQRINLKHKASRLLHNRGIGSSDESRETPCDEEQINVPPSWDPIWLSKTTLGIFIVVFLFLALTLIALYIFSRRDSGLVTQHEEIRYAWKYGPTAVFVLVVSLWMCVDHSCKVLAPFHRMRKRATVAKQGILQDYRSPLNVVALIRSLRNGDIAVSLVILVSVSLQICVVFSTSLFALEPQEIALTTDSTISRSLVQSASNNLYGTVNGDAVSRFYGMATGRIPYPVTTSHNLSIESFVQGESSQGYISYSAKVAGISAKLDCHPLDIGNTSYLVNKNSSITAAPRFAVDIESPDCIMRGVPMGVGPANGPAYTATTISRQGWWGNFTCNSKSPNYRWPTFVTNIPTFKPIEQNLTDRRVVFITSTVQWTPWEHGKNNTRERHTWVQNFTAIMCKPSYSIDNYTVTYLNHKTDGQEPFNAVKQSTASRKINNLTDDDLPSITYTALANSPLFDDLEPDSMNVTDNGNTSYLPKPDKLYFMMSQLNGRSAVSAFLNQSVLLEYAPKAFSGILTQVFDQYFTEPTSRRVSAEYVVLKDRLVLSSLPLALIVSLLVLTTVGTVVLLFVRPVDDLPQELGTISSEAKFLSCSPEFAQTLHALNGPNLGTMDQVLSQREFRIESTSVPRDSDLTICENTYTRHRYLVSQSPKDVKHIWWRPNTSSIWFISLLPALMLLIIVSLELLQRISDSQNGISDFQGAESKHILMTVIPAAVMTIVALAFRDLDFNTCLTAPFLALRRSPKSYRQGLCVALTGRPPVLSLYLALRYSLILPIFSAFTVLIGSFLTTVGSGLYYTESISGATSAVLQQTDELNYAHKDLSISDNFAGLTTSLVYYERSQYPAGTYGQLVFPSLKFQNFTDKGPSPRQVTVRVPALRPRLDCITTNSSNISYQTQTSIASVSSVVRLSAFVELPCFENTNKTGRILNCQYPWQTEMRVTTTSMTNQYVAGIQTTEVSTAYTPGEKVILNNTTQPSHPLAGDLPGLLYYYGTVNTKRTNASLTVEKASISGVLCFQRIDMIQSILTLDLPKLTISTSTPPQVLENSSKAVELSYLGSNSSTFAYSLDTLLSSLIRNESDITTTTLGPFFWALLNGPTHRDPGEFFSPNNRSQLQAAVNNLYAMYIVQVLNANSRYNITTNITDSNQTEYSPLLLATQTTFEGQTTEPTRQRLKQQSEVKLALQVMLAVMTLCAIIIFIFGGTKALLPHNPCTIAGSMFLLAGSELTARKLIPPGTEYNKDSRVWDGWFFSLGWWGTQENPRYGIDFGMAEKTRSDLPTQRFITAVLADGDHDRRALGHGNTDLGDVNRLNPTSDTQTGNTINNRPAGQKNETMARSDHTSSVDLSDIFQGYTSSIDRDDSHRSHSNPHLTTHQGPSQSYNHSRILDPRDTNGPATPPSFSFDEGDDHISNIGNQYRREQRGHEPHPELNENRGYGHGHEHEYGRRPEPTVYPKWI